MLFGSQSRLSRPTVPTINRAFAKRPYAETSSFDAYWVNLYVDPHGWSNRHRVVDSERVFQLGPRADTEVRTLLTGRRALIRSEPVRYSR